VHRRGHVAADYGVAWWTVQATINAAAVLPPNVDELRVRRLGIDERRYRRARWFRDSDSGGWRRVEPWMSTSVNARCGQVLGIVDGRDSAAVGGWLALRRRAWWNRIEVVAIDPSAAFEKAITNQLSNAAISDDPFHLVQLANPMVTGVRPSPTFCDARWPPDSFVLMSSPEPTRTPAIATRAGG
jgi:transposase